MTTVSSKLPLEKLNVLTALSAISQTINSALPLDDMLHSLVALTAQFLGADSCTILSLDAEGGQLTVRASAPSLDESIGKALPIDVDTPDWKNLAKQELLQFQPLQHVHAKTLLSAHLTVGTEYLGEIYCYLDTTHISMSEAQMLLSTIANSVALVIKQRQLMDIVAQRKCDEFGADQYFYQIAHSDTQADLYQEKIALIADYDFRKDTDLLHTLETYLECGGSVTITAKELKIHRNTLLQRIERLQSLCSLDLHQHSHWFTLQVAIKIYKLRAVL